jgi:hypothetical protein
MSLTKKNCRILRDALYVHYSVVPRFLWLIPFAKGQKISAVTFFKIPINFLLTYIYYENIVSFLE